MTLSLHMLFLLGQPGCALCPCVVPPGVDYHSDSAMVRLAEAEAGAIFVGSVQGVDTLKVDRFWFPSDTATGRRLLERPNVVRYTFGVSEIWKGQIGHKAELTVRAFSSDCGREFTVGKSYVVYALLRGQQLETYSCLRSQLLQDADEDRRLLRPARQAQE
jgi:hypothetical protein